MGPSPAPSFDLTPLPPRAPEEHSAPETTPTASAPPKLNRQQIGKLRRQYLTTTHGTVTKCGHKFHPTNQPRLNCDDCWEAFFEVQQGVVAGVESILAAFGEEALVNARGSKFVKRYKAFAKRAAITRMAQAAVDDGSYDKFVPTEETPNVKQ